MKHQRKSPAAVKVIACLLLLGSLACFMLPWLKLSADTGPDRLRMSPGELLQNYLGLDAAALKTLVGDELAAEGIQLKEPLLSDLLDRTLDGRFRLYELPVLCREAGELLSAMQQPQSGGFLITASLGLWGLVGVLALLWLVALICQLSDRRGGILPYFLLGCLIAAGLLVLRAGANRILAEQSQALLAEYGLSGLVSALQIETEIVKMGIGAYLCPFLALLALLLMGIRKKQPEKRCRPTSYPARKPGGTGNGEKTASGPAPRSASEWKCPVCGTRMDAGKRFCIRCGCERPKSRAALNCPVCGNRLPGNASFCDRCGATASPGRRTERL